MESSASSGVEVFREPRWFPNHIEPRGNELDFVRLDRDIIAAQAFLDARWTRNLAERRRASVPSLLPCVPPQQPPLNFIWHTGFCCSTLLAKAITRKGYNLSLCEPQVLLDLAEMKRAGLARIADYEKLSELVFHLLSRAFIPGARITVKPAPAANVLIDQAVRQTSGRMLILYSDCRSYLISIIKLGEVGRRFTRGLLIALLGDGNLPAFWQAKGLLAMSDLEIAAITWHLQMAQFQRTWPVLGDRVRSLDCDAFLAAPADVLAKGDGFLSLGLGDDHIRGVMTGSLFERDAKNPEAALNSAQRSEEHRRIAAEFGSELDQIVARSYDVCTTTPRGVPLPAPLVSVDKAYCPAA